MPSLTPEISKHFPNTQTALVTREIWGTYGNAASLIAYRNQIFNNRIIHYFVNPAKELLNQYQANTLDKTIRDSFLSAMAALLDTNKTEIFVQQLDKKSEFFLRNLAFFYKQQIFLQSKMFKALIENIKESSYTFTVLEQIFELIFLKGNSSLLGAVNLPKFTPEFIPLLIFALTSNSALEVLNLNGRIDMAEFFAIVPVIKKCSKLKELHLTNIHLNGEGAEVLAKVIANCPELETLDITNNPISRQLTDDNKGITALMESIVAHCEKFKTLTLNNIVVNFEVIKIIVQLLETRPDIQICMGSTSKMTVSELSALFSTLMPPRSLAAPAFS